MATPTVRVDRASDQDRAIATLLTAFVSDPVMRWLYPDPQQYLTHFPVFARLLGGKAFEHDSGYSADDYRGVALWLPPGVQYDGEALGELLQRSVPERSQEAIFNVLEQVDTYHPTEPHWYLPAIGVDPNSQGKGYGSALLGSVLAECDQQHMPAYLESSNNRNVPLYERHGFEVQGEIRADGTPTLWPMFRKAR